jgi:hypothetical protein
MSQSFSALINVGLMASLGLVPTAQADPFAVQTLVDPATGNTEYRMLHSEFHFATLLIRSTNNALVFRPHPDQGDENGWGSSLDLNPFLAGADASSGIVDAITATATGIDVAVSGPVARGGTGSYGTFHWTGSFTYDSVLQEVRGEGTLEITLDGTLSAAAADLNLHRIASNYLTGVPLVGGGVGDTGDMSKVFVSYGPADPRNFTWVPPDRPAHYPGDSSTSLTSDVFGALNTVDASDVSVAYKPSLSYALTAHAALYPMSWGGQYDLDDAQNPCRGQRRGGGPRPAGGLQQHDHDLRHAARVDSGGP